MRFTKRLGKALHAVGIGAAAAAVGSLNGTLPPLIPPQFVPLVIIGVPALQALLGVKAFDVNWDGSPASTPAPPTK